MGMVSGLIRTRTAQLFFAVTAQSCYSENELSWSGPRSDKRAHADHTLPSTGFSIKFS